MAQHDELALVLDIAEYRETSSLIRVFTENEGRISLVARGLRKAKTAPGMASLQPFNLVRVRFFLKEGSTMGTLAGADLERAAAVSRTSLEAYALISYWFEVLKETSQERAALSDVFVLTVNVLQHQETAPGISLVFLQQLSQLCQFLGFGISWHQCVVCGRTNPAEPDTFSISKGGIVCGPCASKGNFGMTVKPEEQAIISALARAPDKLPDIEEATMVEFLGIVHRFLIYHLERPLKTFEFVKSTLAS